jgi:hypothetical protein
MSERWTIYLDPETDAINDPESGIQRTIEVVPAAEADQLREALREYGQHRLDCRRRIMPSTWDCDCGFDAALEDTPDEP